MKLYKLVEALKVFRDINTDATVGGALVFCLLNRDTSTHVSEIVRRSGMSSSTVSRQMMILSEIGRGAKEGLGLLQYFEDPADRRHKLLKMTPKGRVIHDKLIKILGDQDESN